MLDSDLNLLSRIQLTEPTVCSPILSEDRCTLYYCTAQALKAWELSSGIHRTVAEMSYDRQTVTALLLEDSVIQCQVTDGQTVHSLFFSAENGRQLSRQENMSRILTENSRYYATLPMDSLELLLFGEAGELCRPFSPIRRQMTASSFPGSMPPSPYKESRNNRKELQQGTAPS